jgi:thioredoxin-like negative regulator of GroEL
MVRYGVRGLPTILVFRDGELVDRILGAMAKAALIERLGRIAGSWGTKRSEAAD